MAKAAVVMGSKSDFEVCAPAVKILEKLGVECEIRVLSAHRTPQEAHEFAESADKNGIEVIIAAAGKAAHLGGVIAASTLLPVVGLPIKSSMMDGLDSLLSMVQMPSGIPVACVGVNAGENAGLMAAHILSVKHLNIAHALAAYRQEMKERVLEADADISGR